MPSLHVKLKKAIKAVIFAGVGVGLFVLFSVVVQPIWNDVDYNPVHGIYEEPDNTIETLFVGSSHVRSGISPMELYEKYGICAYDIATDQQPMAASYFWIEEVYSLHSETLDTVVLDVEMLKSDSDTAFYHKAIDPMHLSLRKIQAVKMYSDNFTDFLYNLFPALSYHERWEELEKTDYTKTTKEATLCLRGYHYRTSQWLTSTEDFTQFSTPLRILDETENDVQLNDTSVIYFKKIVSFCEDHDIQLLLIKTPTAWTSSLHNAVQALADEYGLEFIDFNIEPYYSEIGFNIAANVVNPDTVTNLHANYYGAMKITDYLGEYLVSQMGNRDVRGDESYSFMGDELSGYHRQVASLSVQTFTDPCDYIHYALNEGEYTLFLSVKGDAAQALTNEQREYFASIGLTQLSDLPEDASYLAVLENGSVVTEQIQADTGAGSDLDSDNTAIELLSYTGTLPSGTSYTISSGGTNLGDTSSIRIGSTERSANSQGLNIVLYDNKRETYIGNAVFDTHTSPEREIQIPELHLEALLADGATFSSLTGTDRQLYLYNRECENEKTVKLTRQSLGEDGLVTYLEAFWDDPDLEIYLTVQNDASAVLTQSVRTELSRHGLSELSTAGEGDLYLAVVSGGEVVLEECSNSKDTLEYSATEYLLQSGETASVRINGTEAALGEDGLNIVVYDTITELVVDSISFSSEAAKVAG